MKKRIVFFGVKTFPSRGGTDRVAENLIAQLKDKFDITLYCYKDPLAKKAIKGIKVVEFTPVLKGAPGAFMYFLISAIYLLFEQNVDLVHAHKTDTAFFFPLLRLRFKIVATSHEAPYKRDKWGWFIKLYFKVVERMFLSFSNVTTCISKPLTDYYIRNFNKEVIFIPNGVSGVGPTDYSEDLLKSLVPSGAYIDQPFILFAARRLMSTKGCHTFLEALHKIDFKGQVFIAGELNESDPYLHKLKRLADDLNVHFLGFINPLSSLLALVQKSDFFVFPSETEGMSIMLLEVASVGKPIIASDIPENTQIFDASEVLYFSTKNSDDLAEKIQFALDNPDKIRQFGINCMNKVFSEYMWSSIAPKYDQVYMKL